MKKSIKKSSLVAALLLASVGSQSFAADSFADSFKNGEFSGKIKSYYFMEDYDSASTSDNSVWANGGQLSYKTDSFNGLRLGTTFQTSHITNIDDTAGKQNKTMNSSGSVMSEAYLSYTYKNTTLKTGRQFVSLPLIKGSGSRLIKESFEGTFLTNTDIPDTKISLGKVTKYQTRTDGVSSTTNTASFNNDTTNVGDVGEFHDIGTDGAISLYVKNSSIDNLTLQAHYVDFVDEVADLYLDGIYKFKGDFKPFVALQYYNSSYDDASETDSSLIGYKVGATISGFKVHASYTSTDDEGNVNRGIGEAATASFTSASTTSGNYTAGTDTWQVGLAKAFGKLSTKIKYTESDSVSDSKDLNQQYFALKYKFGGSLENLALSTEYTIYDYGSGAESKDKSELRAKFIYSF